MAPKSTTRTVAALLVALAAAGCGGLPKDDDTIDGPALRAELESGLGLTLVEGETVAQPGLANVSATYVGRTSNEKLLVIVFDTSRATRQVDGGFRMPGLTGARVITRDNVAILYQVRRGTTSRDDAIRRIMGKPALLGLRDAGAPRARFQVS